MKAGLLVIAFMLVVVACDASPTEPAAPVPEVAAPRFSAEVVTILKGRFPIGPSTGFNGCTGEFVDFVGEFNLVVRQITSNTGHVNLIIHSVGGHILGVGQTTGTVYVSNEHFNFVQHSGGDASNLIIEFTSTSVSKGPLPNRSVGKFQIFVVINANGEITVDRFVVRGFEECQG